MIFSAASSPVRTQSEMPTPWYALPALYAGVGVNIVSHVLIEHLLLAERAADRLEGP